MTPIPTPRDWTLNEKLLEGLRHASSKDALIFVRSKTARIYIDLLAEKLKIPTRTAFVITFLRARPTWSQKREDELIGRVKEIGNGNNLS